MLPDPFRFKTQSTYGHRHVPTNTNHPQPTPQDPPPPRPGARTHKSRTVANGSTDAFVVAGTVSAANVRRDRALRPATPPDTLWPVVSKSAPRRSLEPLLIPWTSAAACKKDLYQP